MRGRSIFGAEINSKMFGLSYFHLRQVNITHKYTKEILMPDILRNNEKC